MELIEALLALEKQAAIVESFIPADADDAELAELLAPWGPPPRRGKGTTTRGRQILAEDFLAWLRDAASRWEARPSDPHPSGEVMGELLLRWCRRT